MYFHESEVLNFTFKLSTLKYFLTIHENIFIFLSLLNCIIIYITNNDKNRLLLLCYYKYSENN